MSDFGAPVAQNVDVNPQKAIQTISGLVGLKQQQQNLQTGQYAQDTAQAGAYQAQQSAKERQAGAQILSDPVGNGITDKNGNPTANAQTILSKVMPTTWKDHYDSMLNAAENRVKFEGAATQLTQTQKGIVSDAYAGKAADPSANVDDLKTTGAGVRATFKGTPAEEHINNLTNLLDSGMDEVAKDHGPEGAKRYVMGLNRGFLGAAGLTGAGGVAAPQRATMDNGPTIQPGTTAPALQGGNFTASGPPIQKDVAPQLGTDTNQSPAVLSNKGVRTLPVAPGGATTPATPGIRRPDGTPKTAMDDAPPPNAPRAVVDSYAQATKGANVHVDQIRNADESYGNNTAVANTIRKLSQDTTTGPGSEYFHHAMAGLGMESGSNYQELGAFLDRQAATLRTQMGLPDTNAGAADARSIAGNTQYSPKAIQDKNDYTQALTEGLHAYRNGLDRVAGFSGQASPTVVNAFKSAWTNNFDPNVYKGELAFKRSDADGTAFMKSLVPEEAKSLSAKRNALQQLSNGQLPK